MFLLQISVKKETQQTYKFKAGRIKCTWMFGKKDLTRRVSIEDLFPLKSLNFPGHQQYETPMHLESLAWTPNDQLRGLGEVPPPSLWRATDTEELVLEAREARQTQDRAGKHPETNPRNDHLRWDQGWEGRTMTEGLHIFFDFKLRVLTKIRKMLGQHHNDDHDRISISHCLTSTKKTAWKVLQYLKTQWNPKKSKNWLKGRCTGTP